MHQNKQFNLKNFLAIAFLAILVIISAFFWSQLKLFIRSFLEFEQLHYIIYGLVFIIYVIDYYSDNNQKEENSQLGSNFNSFFDTVVSSTSYGIGITSSLTVIKGFYIQSAFDDAEYFTEFSKIDTILLVLTMCFLLYFCLSRVVLTMKRLIWTYESVAVK
tara:strand:+ start:108284 stop:108766 length:483 start_codon:yes stop_codon:yes gene_type:complete